MEIQSVRATTDSPESLKFGLIFVGMLGSISALYALRIWFETGFMNPLRLYLGLVMVAVALIGWRKAFD